MKSELGFKSMALTLAGALVLSAGTPALAAEFSADMVQIDEYGDAETVRTYIKGDLRRDEIIDDGEIEGWTIFRPDKGVVWNVSPDDEMYIEIPLNIGGDDIVQKVEQLEESTTRKPLGTETVNGYECEKVHYQYQAGSKGGFVVWHSKELNYPVRIVQKDLKGKTTQTTEIRNIDTDTVPVSKFEIPAGYEKMTMPGMPGMPEGVLPDFANTDIEKD